ncbi:O-antigen ligase family protein [Helicobacter sp. 23-1044]
MDSLKRTLQFIKNHNEIIVLTLLCVGIFFYAIGVSKILNNFRAQSFIFIAGAIFALCNFRRFSKKDWQILRIPAICIGILITLGFITYFNSVLPPKNFGALLRAINQHIVGYFALFCLCYFFGKYASQKVAWRAVHFFALMCVVNVIAMCYLIGKNGFYHESFIQNIPFFFKAIFTYNIWILAPIAISLAGIFVFKNLWRWIFVLCFIFSIVAMIGNGERSFFVAFGVMIFVPFIVYKYHYKKWILLAFLGISSVAIYGLLHFSKDLPMRYNAYNIISNVSEVWQTTPVEMGKYDPLCFGAKWLDCEEESTKNGLSEINLDHSTLSRLNMTKSTLLAFWDNPFKPHIVGPFQVGEYLWHYYNLYNPQNRSYIIFSNENSNYQQNGYNHPHNFVASLALCYGIIGLLCIAILQGFLFYSGTRAIKTSDNQTKFIGLGLCIFVCGMCAQSFFDGFYHNILETIFIIQGILIGLMWRKISCE